MLGVVYENVEVQQAAIAVPVLISIGIALLARLLFKPKDKQPLRDDKPNTATQRGAFIPLVIGRRQVGAVVLWVGGRQTQIEEEEVGGKGGGGGGTIKKTIYYEQGVHALCVGPAARIHAIYKDGELLPNSQGLSTLTAPSGTSVNFGEFGDARIYWGERDQPVSSLFSGKLGIATRAPYVCRIEWDRARLGQNARWPIIEYEVETVPSSGGSQPFDAEVGDDGINHAWAAWQIFTAPYPHGGGLSTDWMDFTALTTLGDLLAAEAISCNLLIQDGDPVDKIMGELMQDAGFILPLCEGVIAPFAMRKYTDTIETLTDDLLLPPVEEIEKVHRSLLGDALVYEYADRNEKYRSATIDVDDDSVGATRNQRKVKKVPLSTITVRSVASKVVNRRSVEDLDNPAAVKITGLRNMRHCVAGQPFTLPGVGVVRVVDVLPDFESSKAQINLLKDPFDREITDYEDPDLPGGEVGEGDLEPDTRYMALEVPAVMSLSPAVAVLRIRANQSIVGANILASGDDVSYEIVGVQNSPATGGILDADFSLTRMGYLGCSNNPQMTIDENGDENDITNQSGNPSAWVSGENLMVIYDPSTDEWEAFFVQDFSQVSGTTYEATCAIPNRAHTRKPIVHNWFRDHSVFMRTFPAESEVYIIASSEISPGTGGVVQLGGVQYIKSQPSNAQGTLPAAACGRFDIPWTSEALKPGRIPWVLAGGDSGSLVSRRDFLVNDDPTLDEELVFEFPWEDRANGAGQQGAGQATASITPPGNIRIEVWYITSTLESYTIGESFAGDDNEVLVRTSVESAASLYDASTGLMRWEYSRTERVADGIGNGNYNYKFVGVGGDLSNDLLEVRLYHEIDGVQSAVTVVRPMYIDIEDLPGQ